MTMTDVASKFFSACQAGLGYQACKDYCTENATFSAQSEPLADVTTVKDYCDWAKMLMKIIPDGHYDLVSIATDERRQCVIAYGVFHGTHTGDGGPVRATGKSCASDYVLVMQFEGDKIRHVTKIWHSHLAMQALGWV
jgi:predicted ester cyclase